MIPVFNLFGKEISAYLIMGLIGVFAMMGFGLREAKKSDVNELQMLSLFCWSFVGIIVGGHLMYGVTQIQKIISLIHNFEKITSLRQFADCMVIIFGGSVYYGGLIGVLLIGFLFCKARKLDTGSYFDIGAMSVALFHFFGRIGCFLGGCCYGIEWKYGVTYHYSPVEACNGVPRFPVQLIEAVLNLILFFVLYYCHKNGYFKKMLMAVYCLVYPTYRFILEYYRADEYRGFLGGLSTSQIISLLFIIFTLAVIFAVNHKKLKAKKSSEPNTASEKDPETKKRFVDKKGLR